MVNTLSVIIIFSSPLLFNYCGYAGAFPLELGRGREENKTFGTARGMDTSANGNRWMDAWGSETDDDYLYWMLWWSLIWRCIFGLESDGFS